MREKKAWSDPDALLHAAAEGTLPRKLKKYLKECRPPPDSDPKKDPGRLPTLSGFCGMLGCGLQAAERMAQEYPSEYDFLCAVLEDEALNSARPPALLNAYLKERLGYGERPDPHADEGPLQPIFEHDILEDGA